MKQTSMKHSKKNNSRCCATTKAGRRCRKKSRSQVEDLCHAHRSDSKARDRGRPESESDSTGTVRSSRELKLKMKSEVQFNLDDLRYLIFPKHHHDREQLRDSEIASLRPFTPLALSWGYDAGKNDEHTAFEGDIEKYRGFQEYTDPCFRPLRRISQNGFIGYTDIIAKIRMEGAFIQTEAIQVLKRFLRVPLNRQTMLKLAKIAIGAATALYAGIIVSSRALLLIASDRIPEAIQLRKNFSEYYLLSRDDFYSYSSTDEY